MVPTSALSYPSAIDGAIYKQVRPKTLTPHPLNCLIYGEEEDVSELVDLISKKGWIKPLVVTPQNRIISGHRRWKSAVQLGLELVPVEVREFPSELAELEALLLENTSRLKTTEQKIREANAWKNVEAEKSRARQLSTLRKGSSTPATPNLASREKGETREKVARRVGLGKTNYEKGARVVEIIDEQMALGNLSQAQTLRKVLNQSVDAAYQLIKKSTEKRSQILETVAQGKTIKEALALHKPSSSTKLDELEPSGASSNLSLQRPPDFRSCWNCKYRGEFLDNNQSFQCYKYGVVSFINSDVKEVAAECDDWEERTGSPDQTDYSNPRFKTCSYQLYLPASWQDVLEERATREGVSAEEWIKILIGTNLFPPSDNGNGSNGNGNGSNEFEMVYTVTQKDQTTAIPIPDAIAPVVKTATLETITYNDQESAVLAEPQTIGNDGKDIAQQPEPEAEVKIDACGNLQQHPLGEILQAETRDAVQEVSPRPHSLPDTAETKEEEELQLQREYQILMNQFSANDFIEVSEKATSFKGCIGVRGRVATVWMEGKQISVNLDNGLTNIRFWANELILIAKAETFTE